MLPYKRFHNDSIKAKRASRVRTKARKEKERIAIRSKSGPASHLFVRVSSSIRELSVKSLRKCSKGTVYGSGGESGRSRMRRFLLRLFLVIPGGEECEIMNEPVRSDFFFVGVTLPLAFLWV